MANVTLNQALAEILTKASQTMSDGISFLSAEIPEVARQFLTYNLYNSVLYAVFSLAVFLCILDRYLKFLKTRDKKHFMAGERHFIVSVMSLVFGSLFLFLLLYEVSKIIKITVAPKIYLIEWAASIIK